MKKFLTEVVSIVLLVMILTACGRTKEAEPVASEVEGASDVNKTVADTDSSGDNMSAEEAENEPKAETDDSDTSLSKR